MILLNTVSEDNSDQGKHCPLPKLIEIMLTVGETEAQLLINANNLLGRTDFGLKPD